MFNSTLSKSYCAGDVLSRGHHNADRYSASSGLPNLVLDVRRSAAMQSVPRTIPGAILAPDLSLLARHSSLFANVGKVRLFCVYGHERSQAAAIILQQLDCEIEDIRGGLEAYVASGGETVQIIEGKTASLDSERLWLFNHSVEDAIAAWAMKRFVDPLSSYQFASKAYAEKVLAELQLAGLSEVSLWNSGEENTLTALLEEFDFQQFPVLMETVIPVLQQSATHDFLMRLPIERVGAFCDHIWMLAQQRSDMA